MYNEEDFTGRQCGWEIYIDLNEGFSIPTLFNSMLFVLMMNFPTDKACLKILSLSRFISEISCMFSKDYK